MIQTLRAFRRPDARDLTRHRVKPCGVMLKYQLFLFGYPASCDRHWPCSRREALGGNVQILFVFEGIQRVVTTIDLAAEAKPWVVMLKYQLFCAFPVSGDHH